MLKRLVALAALTTLVALAVGYHNRRAAMQEVDGATLSGMAAQALARGESEVYLAKHDSYDAVDSLDAALSRYTVVEATPIAKQSYVFDEISIGTWYKFRVHSILRQNPLPACSGCGPMPTPPADMLPLNADEILVLHGGGSQVVNGVTFFVTVPNFPDYSLNQRYLLFIDYDPTSRVGMVSVGPPGVYLVDGYGNLSHIYDDPDDSIGSGLAASYGSNINHLRNALNPPPSGCDPVQEQNCRGIGYDWDPSACLCSPPPNPCGGYSWQCY